METKLISSKSLLQLAGKFEGGKLCMLSETRLSDDETKDEDVVGNDVATRKGNDESTEEMIKSYFLRGTKITNLEGSDTLFELLGGSVLKEYEEDSVRVSNVSGMLQEFI